MTHLVTGAAGFIGSHLANTLHARGERVVGVDDLSGGWVDNLHQGIPLVAADVAEVDLDDVIGVHEVDVVWHLAAYAAEGLSHWVRTHNVRNNWLATTRLINSSIRQSVDRMFFTSSMAVYGSQHPPFTETMLPAPEDPYGIAKYAAEQDLHAAADMFGLDVTVFRPHNVYGPGQNCGDRYRNVVGIFMRQALYGGPLTIFGDGRQVRAFSYITDIVAPMVAAYEQDVTGTFNIGGEQPVTILDLARKVSDLFDGVPIRHLEERREVREAWCDHTRARHALGFSPEVDLDDGLEEMAEWVRAKGVRWTTPPPVEVSAGLPEFWRHPLAALS